MATLMVRNVDAGLVETLKSRARSHGRSVAAEHRAILQEVLAPRWSTQDLIEALQSCSWIGELDVDQLRNRDAPRELEFDPTLGAVSR